MKIEVFAAVLAAMSASPCAASVANLDIRDFGAKAGEISTVAIQKALDAAEAAGGGVVVVPSGKWTTGTIWLRSRVELRLENGAVLKGSTRSEDYNRNDAFPENFWSDAEEWSGGHLLLGYKVEDVAITGEGTIDGSGLDFFGECDEDSRFPHYKYGLRLHPKDRQWFRPGPMVAFFLSKNIRVSGVRICNAPAWTTHFRCCDGLVIRGVTIRNDRTIANTDGFSIDCTRNVEVSGCTVSTGDDTFAIRASCKLHAAEHPCENIRISDCDLASCAMGARIGIGTGTIRNVTMERCVVRESSSGVFFYSAWRPGRKGCDISDVRVSDCEFLECDRPVENIGIADEWLVEGVVFERCKFASLRPSLLRGSSARRLRNVAFRSCERAHLDRLSVRHHRGFGGERSRKFIEVEGEVWNLVVDNCRPAP